MHMQSTDTGPGRGHEKRKRDRTGVDLLWIPKRGNMPPKLDRMKEFAARALAEYRGYASTRKVKIPE